MTKSAKRNKLIIIHKDLRHIFTGGQYRLAQVITHAKKRNLRVEVIDCEVLPESLRKNRTLLFLYLLRFFSRHRKNIFTFTDHGTHFYLLIPLFVSRMFGCKYGLNCLQTFYNFRSNLLLRWLEFILEYLFLQGASFCLFPSKSSIDYFRSLHIKHKTKIIVNPAAKILCSNKIKFRNRVRNLIFVGQIQKWKGLDILVQAMGRLKHLNLHLDVAGYYNPNSKYYQSIMNMICSNKLQRNITFHGNLSARDLAALYKKADIFILSSRYETYGIVLLEAMSFGLPIISSTIPSAKDILKKTINAIFYDTENPEALAQSIELLTVNTPLRKKIQKNNLQASAKPRTWKMVADGTLKIIEKYL